MDPANSPLLNPPLPQPRRPAGLTTLCVLTIILGALGALIALQTLASLGMHFAGGSTFTAGPGITPEMAEVQNEMQAATRTIIDKYLPYSSLGLVLQIGLCAAFLYGGIQTLKLRESGRSVLFKAFVAALVIEPMRTVVGIFASYDSLTIMQPFMARMMDSMGPPGKGPPPQLGMVMGQFMYVAMIASLVFYVVWLLVKCGYFLWARSYLRRDEIARLFA